MSFAAQHYAALAVCAFAAWGAGACALALLRVAPLEAPDEKTPGRPKFSCPPRGAGWAQPGPGGAQDPWLEAALAAALGLGLYVLAFQGLGLAGLLRPPAVGALVAAGLLGAALRAPAMRRALRGRPRPPLTAAGRAALAVAWGAFAVSLVEPLSPPHAFDEMMYHLPWAREVAASGRIGVYDWLRYPWFPYNYNLLYAAAMPLMGDVFPHLLHALAGWIAALLIYRLALRHTDRVTACMAAVILLAVGEYANALIDMGVALFVLAACVLLWDWRADAARDPRRLMLAAFLLGVAAGSKYQALTFLPLLGVFVLWRERRPGVLLAGLAVFLLPCIYWYGRNWLHTGDPFNPIGARVFGFTNWNAADYRQQVDDVRVHAALPNVMLWPALLVPWCVFWKARPAVRAAFAFGAWSVLVWVATSRYPRYMMAAFPMLAWLGAMGWRQLYLWAAAGVRRWTPALARAPVPRIAGGALLALLAVVGVQRMVVHARMVAATPEAREAFLRANVPGYEVLRYVHAHGQGRLYQVGLNDAIYFAGQPAWGDVFGPYRLSDYILLPPEALARKLASQGFGTIVVNTAIAPYVDTQPGFARYFAPLFVRGAVKAYRVLPTSSGPTP